MPIIRGVTEF